MALKASKEPPNFAVIQTHILCIVSKCRDPIVSWLPVGEAVGDSVGDHVGDSVGNPVGGSVGDPVGNFFGNLVDASVSR